MGLRRWLKRGVRGVEDLTRGGEAYPIEHRREWAIDTIDSAPFQIWVVIVAGVGFLTDAYDIFALTVIIPMLGYVFWRDQGGVVPTGWQTAMTCATLAGTMIGQVAFGVAADFLGRRKMYGLELLIVIVATVLLASSSRGELDSMQVEGWLITWRFVMGLGIGADYPLSAVITSEFAPRKYRARMMSSVFFMQPIGQLLANVVAIVAIVAWKPWIEQQQAVCQADECVRVIDRMWRLVVGLGAVPAALALAFRFTIPESPRYKMDVKGNISKTCEDMNDFYGRENDLEQTHEMQSLRPKTSDEGSRTGLSPTVGQSSSADHGAYSPVHGHAGADIVQDDVLNVEDDVIDTSDYQPIDPHQAAGTVSRNPSDNPPLASSADIKKFFITEGNWRHLLGTSLSWLFLDFAFYGLGLSSPIIIHEIWSPDGDKQPVYQTLFDNSTHFLIMVSVGAVVGGAAMIKVIKYASPKVLQFWGFVVLGALFIITGSVWPTLLQGGRQTGLIVLYVLCQIVFNLGPNVTTFIIPAEIFPTRYRCTCHGISAAMGKLGSWSAQLFIQFAFKRTDEKEWLGHVLQAMTAFMIAGAVTTHFLVPETRDHKGRSRSLEVLGEGRKRLQELNRRSTEDD